VPALPNAFKLAAKGTVPCNAATGTKQRWGGPGFIGRFLNRNINCHNKLQLFQRDWPTPAIRPLIFLSPTNYTINWAAFQGFFQTSPARVLK
jgi:hypothetical protein